MRTDLSAKLDLNIDTQYTRIVISKDHMDTILNAVLSAETDCWPD